MQYDTLTILVYKMLMSEMSQLFPIIYFPTFCLVETLKKRVFMDELLAICAKFAFVAKPNIKLCIYPIILVLFQFTN
jgi:hypothetical protein